jgi:hypothetical protein
MQKPFGGPLRVKLVEYLATRSLRICTDNVIANVLDRNGRRRGRGNFWTRERVMALRTYHGTPIFCAERNAEEGWMNLTDAAHSLGITAPHAALGR